MYNISKDKVRFIKTKLRLKNVVGQKVQQSEVTNRNGNANLARNPRASISPPLPQNSCTQIPSVKNNKKRYKIMLG